MMKQEIINSPLISIIVPIYNMEKLMRKCLDSILAQTFTDYECLLIDDGSKDGSPAICDEYAAKYARFKAFHKPNGGLSDARNYGLAHAQGEYTIFFDPDDWVDEDCLKDMYAKVQETDADMVICDYYNEDSYRRQYIKQTPSSFNHQEVLEDIITGKLFGYTWNKLLKRDLYSHYQLEYTKGMYGCEDQYTMCALLKNDIKIAYLPKAYYHYMHYGNETQSRRYDKGTYEMDKHMLKMFVDLFEGHPLQELVRIRKTSYMVGHAFLGGKNYFSDAEFISEFQKYESILKLVPRMSFINFLYWCSFRGFYHTSINVYNFFVAVNELLKSHKLK